MSVKTKVAVVLTLLALVAGGTFWLLSGTPPTTKASVPIAAKHLTASSPEGSPRPTAMAEPMPPSQAPEGNPSPERADDDLALQTEHPPVPPCDLHGTVRDATPDLSGATWAKFENWAMQIQDQSEASRQKMDDLLKEIQERSAPRPARGAIVTAQSAEFTTETVTDAQGVYRFAVLPPGSYAISARLSVRPPSGKGPNRVTTATQKFWFRTRSWQERQLELSKGSVLDLELHAEAVVLRGRVADTEGLPIAGAKVTGELVPPYNPEIGESGEGEPFKATAVSGADGTFEIGGFQPEHILRLAYYLGRGDPARVDQVHIRAEADGFVQAKSAVPKVPLVTGEMADPARYLLRSLRHWQSLETRRAKTRGNVLREPKDMDLPPGQDNVIAGIAIVLERVAPSGRVSGRVLTTKDEPVANRVLALSMVESPESPLSNYEGVRKRIETITGEDGTFDLPDVAPGLYSLLVYGPPPDQYNGYQVPVNGRTCEVKPGERTEGLELLLNPPEDYAISGHVRDAEGKPLRKVFVSTAIKTGFAWWAETDDSGAYRIEGLDGTELSSFRVNFRGHVDAGRESFQLAIPDVPLNASDVDVTLPGRGGIDGAVLRASTKEAVTLHEVKVTTVALTQSRAVWENPHVVAKPKLDGTFAISGVPAGEATVEVRSDGFGTQRFAVTVEAATTSTLECHLLEPTKP